MKTQWGRLFLALGIMTLAATITHIAAADWDEGGPHKMHEPQLPDLSPEGIDVNATDVYLADDFMCTADGLITAIHVWGSWLADQDQPQASFLLTIYEDAPPGQPGNILWSKLVYPGGYIPRVYAGQIEEGWLDPPENYIPPPADTICWQYNFPIDRREAFIQESGKTYWLEVRAMTGGEGRFGWKTARPDLRWRQDAHWSADPPAWNPLEYPPPHPFTPQSLDLAFVINGESATVCGPLPDGTGCEPVTCPDPNEQCLPKRVELDPATGQYAVVECACTRPDDCRVTIVANGAVCIQPDNGGGTVDLPPEGCGYLSPDEVWHIIDGLPPGTTIEIAGAIDSFFDVFRAQGGSLGGEVQTFQAEFPTTMTGTGDLAGFVRSITIPLDCETHTGPRNPGDPIQEFGGEWVRLQGEIFGDPDFDVLRITAGTDLGLPSPGQTTLTQLPTGDFAVDSFFDITYQIEFQGAPGSQLADLAGTTTGTIRVQTGSSLSCAGVCPNAGDTCDPVLTANNGMVVFECDCTPAGQDQDLGDAPEGALAYPAAGTMGQFPTCMNVGPPLTFVSHGLGWAHFGAGPAWDAEPEGNAGLCPLFNPNAYDADECFADGDAGLLLPDAYTIVGPVGAEQVVPCGGPGAALGLPCTLAIWGQNLDIHVVNHMPVDGFVNVLVDWNQDGIWNGGSSCPPGPAPEHILVDFPVPVGFDGQLSALTPPPFVIGPLPGHVWARFSITERPVGTQDWDGTGVFEDGESEDYLLRINTPPVADANGPYSGDEGSSITLDGTASFDPDGVIAYHEWDLDNDGVFGDAFGPNPTWSWPDDGSYPIRLRVFDYDGGQDTDTTSVTINNVDPALGNLAATDCVEGNSTTFSGTITDPGALDTFTLHVDWGDGTPIEVFGYPAGATAFSETHPYRDDDPSGTPQDPYTITVTLTDDDLGFDNGSTGLTVRNVRPSLSALNATNCDEGGSSTLSGNINDPGTPDTFTLRVDWDDGSPVEVFGYSAGTTMFSETHPYGPSGPYTVHVWLEDDDTGIDTGSAPLTVRNVPPTADADGPYSGLVGEPIALDGSGSSDPGNDIIEYAWDLNGDGVFDDAFGATPSYAWYAPGLFTIRLRVTDDDGAVDVDAAQVQVDRLAGGEPCPKWVQGPDCEFGLDVESWTIEPSAAAPGPRIADDWLCDGRPLVGLQWWGSYREWRSDDPNPDVPPPPGPERPIAFRIAWYEDIPATPEGHSRPGRLLEERLYPLADFGPPQPIPGVVVEDQRAGCVVDLGFAVPGLFEHEYAYTLLFPDGEEFNEKEGTVYWISVQAVYDSQLPLPPWLWGWATTPIDLNWNDDAVVTLDEPDWREMIYPPPGWEWAPHPYEGKSVNMAFVLLTDVCPGRCVKWDQPPDMIEGMDMLSSRVMDDPGPLRADDFVSDGRIITDIHWWGSYIGWRSDNPGIPPTIVYPPTGPDRPVAFELSWHLEDPSDKTLPGPAISRVIVPMDRCHETYYGTVDQFWWDAYEHEYQYYVDLLDPRIYEAAPWPEKEGEHYWLNIQAVFGRDWEPGNAHHGWGWKITPAEESNLAPSAFSPDGIGWWHEVLPPDHPRGPVEFDLAFELTTTAIPDPAVVPLSVVFVEIRRSTPDTLWLESKGACGCGVQILQQTLDVAVASPVWIDIDRIDVPRAVNVWTVSPIPPSRAFYRVKSTN